MERKHVPPEKPARRKRCHCGNLELSAYRYTPWMVYHADDYTPQWICDICWIKQRDDIFYKKHKMLTIWQMVGADPELLDERGFPKSLPKKSKLNDDEWLNRI